MSERSASAIAAAIRQVLSQPPTARILRRSVEPLSWQASRQALEQLLAASAVSNTPTPNPAHRRLRISTTTGPMPTTGKRCTSVP
ncbi:MAG: hypothetical protein R3F17_09070 [Planctomycetota bacterium]